MPVISACRDLFPAADAPWTLTEISERLLCIEAGMNYDRVYRAWRCLLDHSAMRDLVLPMNQSRPLRFREEQTRRIARQALSRRTKRRVVEMARTGTAVATGAVAPSNSAAKEEKEKLARNQSAS